jgi:hypothetical protein
MCSINMITCAVSSRQRHTWLGSATTAVDMLCIHVCRVIVLEDNDVLHLTGGGYGIYNTAQQVRQPSSSQLLGATSCSSLLPTFV